MEKVMHRADFLKRGTDKIGRPYATWTKEGVRNWTQYVLHHPESMAEIHIHLAEKNIKLDALMFSTPAGPKTEYNSGLGTCEGLPCHDICYATREEQFRPSAMVSHIENALMLMYAFDRCVSEFVHALQKYKAKCEKAGKECNVRWHQAGEFNQRDSALLDVLAKLFPDVSFYGYTKREQYYCKYYGAKNINILWSLWRGMDVPESVRNCGPLKAFGVIFKDGNNGYLDEWTQDKKRVRKCPGLIKGEFACNRCKFQCKRKYIILAKEH